MRYFETEYDRDEYYDSQNVPERDSDDIDDIDDDDDDIDIDDDDDDIDEFDQDLDDAMTDLYIAWA